MVTTRGGAATDKAVNAVNTSAKTSRKRSSADEFLDLPVREKRRKPLQKQGEEKEETEAEPTHDVIATPVQELSAIPQIDGASDTTAVPAQSQKSSHIRFGSHSPPPQIPVEPQDAPTNVAADEAESDDDEAPEAVSVSQAAADIRAAQAEEARALKLQEEEVRERRRKRDLRLKAQAQDSEKRQSRVANADDTSVEDTAISQTPAYDINNLPQLLPEELLATEAPLRPPTPPPMVLRKEGHGTRKVLDTDDTPKDLAYKNTNIRVLKSRNALLPPKPVGEVRAIRESWLKGRSSFEKKGKRGHAVSKLKRRPGPKAFV